MNLPRQHFQIKIHSEKHFQKSMVSYLAYSVKTCVLKAKAKQNRIRICAVLSKDDKYTNTLLPHVQTNPVRCRIQEWVGTLAHYCVNFSHLPMGSFTAVAPLAAVYLRVIADTVSRDRWQECLGFNRRHRDSGCEFLWWGSVFAHTALISNRPRRLVPYFWKYLVTQFVLTFAIAFITFSPAVNIFTTRFIRNECQSNLFAISLNTKRRSKGGKQHFVYSAL